MTGRRDLRELDAVGLLRRVHGRALPGHGDASSFAPRTRRAPEAKASIARRAAACARDGQVVVLDRDTTTLELARCNMIRSDVVLLGVVLAPHRSLGIEVLLA